MSKVAMTHTGNGVVIVGHSGAVYRAEPGETINLLAIDAEGLKDHPEWMPADSDEKDTEETPVLEGDDSE